MDTNTITKGMKTATGISGIKNFLAMNVTKRGWHVFVDNDYCGYYAGATIAEVYNSLVRNDNMTGTNRENTVFTGWTGNGLSFTTRHNGKVRYI